MRLHWRSHNMQKFEAMPHGETTNLVRGYDGMRDESGQSDADLRRDTSLLAGQPGEGGGWLPGQSTDAVMEWTQRVALDR